jgi:hypothetical protein
MIASLSTNDITISNNMLHRGCHITTMAQLIVSHFLTLSRIGEAVVSDREAVASVAGIRANKDLKLFPQHGTPINKDL